MNIIYYWSKLFKKFRGASVKNSKIHPTSKVESGSMFVGSSMGKYSFCGYDCEIINCQIGAYCSIANHVIIGGASHPIDWVSTSPVFYYGRDSVKKKFSTFHRDPGKITVIGNDVWIGDGAHIKQGVTVGDGAVVGMGAVVTKDVKPYTIVAGNPARLIRNRFDDTIIESLVKSKWWEFPEEKIQSLSKYIQNPEEFIKHL